MNVVQRQGLLVLRMAGAVLIGLLLSVAGSVAATPGGIGGTGIDPGGIGGTGISPGSIGGTGIVAIGPVQRFGSIFVNGGEYELGPQTRYRVDGQPATERSQHLGDMVTVHAVTQGGRLDALDVRVDHAVIGRVAQIDLHAARLVVLGQTIHLSSTTLLCTETDQPLLLSQLSVGDVVRISALYLGADQWQALRLVRLARPAGQQAVKFLLRGRIEALSAIGANPQRVRINGVWLSSARLMARNGLLVGAQVVVRGTQGRQGNVIDSLLPSLPAEAPIGARVVMVGYLQQTQQGWEANGLRVEGSDAVLRAELQSAAGTRRAPLIIVGILGPAQTVVAERIIPNVDAMQFALPPQAGTARPSPAKTGDAASVGGAAAQTLQSLQPGQGVNVPTPGMVSPALPAVILPQVITPAIPSVPQVPQVPQIPSVNVPSVSPPSIAPPQVPTVAPPTVSTPNVATPTLPSSPQIPSMPRP
jgi:hypothetical protein